MLNESAYGVRSLSARRADDFFILKDRMEGVSFTFFFITCPKTLNEMNNSE